MNKNIELLFKEKGFKEHIIDRLKTVSSGYAERLSLIDEKRNQGEKYSASGVLIPLEFARNLGEWTMIFNKRSDYVQQPGDLCFPGGGMGHKVDRVLRFLLNRRVFSAWRMAFKRLRVFPSVERKAISLILATALRESWEEMRLPPWKVEFLGILPVYSLLHFTKSIFPVVGLIKGKWRIRSNWEVEKVIPVPIRSFFNSTNYVRYLIEMPVRSDESVNSGGYDAPAFVVPNSRDDDILWGATYSIMMDFFNLALGFPVANFQGTRVVERTLPAHYYTGKKRRKA